MYFLVDNDKKFIIGWSAKCGCTHLKNLFSYITDKVEDIVHKVEYMEMILPDIIDDYTVLIVLRNPYDRFVSGFLDKYQLDRDFYFGKFTFREFVTETVKGNFLIINEHHFTPQLSEKWSLLKGQPKQFIVNDLYHIDYAVIEKIYDKKIPASVLNFRGQHTTHDKTPVNYKVYDIIQTTYAGKKPLLRNFFDDSIKEKIYNFYKVDFEFAAKHNIHYEL